MSTHDIDTGRWTTPDPAASPWSNLQDYVGENPISRSDPSGLKALLVKGKKTFKEKCGSWEADVTQVWKKHTGGKNWKTNGGIDIHISFKPDPKCCCCTEIKLIQFSLVKEDGVKNVTGGSANKSMHPDKLGWLVDAYTEGDPWFSAGKVQFGKCKPLKSAKYTDHAGWYARKSKHKKAEFRATVCAICTDNNKLLGCFTWAFDVTKDRISWNAWKGGNAAENVDAKTFNNNFGAVKAWNKNEATKIPTVID